jgi:hypothetical protein
LEAGAVIAPPAGADFAGIDPAQPWMAPLRGLVHLLAAPDPRAALSDAARRGGVTTAGGRPVCFVDAADAAGTPYETHVAATGRVPTRLNRHDLFNALMWLAFPRAKATLNARQAAAIARTGIGARRGPVRDAATLIDESGLLLATHDPAVSAALAAHDWQQLLVRWRARWGRDIVPVVFGHALLDKLAGPFKAITAAVVVLRVPVAAQRADATATLDAPAAQFLQRPALAPSGLHHLPVLGIPGWCAANEDPHFYDDEAVFRPARGLTGHSRPAAGVAPEAP